MPRRHAVSSEIQLPQPGFNKKAPLWCFFIESYMYAVIGSTEESGSTVYSKNAKTYMFSNILIKYQNLEPMENDLRY